MLDPIAARAKVRIRVVRLATFIFAGFKDCSKLWLLDVERSSYI